MKTLGNEDFGSAPSLDLLIARAAAKPVALVRVARALAAKGSHAQARELAARAQALAPGDGEVCSLAAEILGLSVPEWHFAIVRDHARNAAYDTALRRSVRPGMRVFEIGAGTGLLAMMAARAGAAAVVTCEGNLGVSQVAREIVARNGYADRVRVVAKMSEALDPVADLGGLADMMVSEIVSNDMVGEGVLPAIEQAHRRLLRAGAPVIPARGRVRIALAEDLEFERRRMGVIDGFDLSPFNRLAGFRYRINPGEGRVALRSDAHDLFTFDFQAGGPFPEARATVTIAAQGGRVTGVAQWIRLEMDEETHYENRPAAGLRSAWAAQFYPFPQPIELPAGTPITVHGAHDRLTLRVWAEIP